MYISFIVSSFFDNSSKPSLIIFIASPVALKPFSLIMLAKATILLLEIAEATFSGLAPFLILGTFKIFEGKIPFKLNPFISLLIIERVFFRSRLIFALFFKIPLWTSLSKVDNLDCIALYVSSRVTPNSSKYLVAASLTKLFSNKAICFVLLSKASSDSLIAISASPLICCSIFEINSSACLFPTSDNPVVFFKIFISIALNFEVVSSLTTSSESNARCASLPFLINWSESNIAFPKETEK